MARGAGSRRSASEGAWLLLYLYLGIMAVVWFSALLVLLSRGPVG